MKKLLVFVLLMFAVQNVYAQIRMDWKLSKEYAFTKAKEYNSLVMVYYYSSENAEITKAVEDELFEEAGESAFSTRNSLVDFLNDNLFSIKEDLDVKSVLENATSLNIDYYPAFIWYYPNGIEAHRVVGFQLDYEIHTLIEKLNDEFQEESLLKNNKAHFRYLEKVFEENMKQSNCDIIGCNYPIITRFFKSVPEGEELPYNLLEALEENTLDLDGPEIIWLRNHFTELDMDKEDLVYAFYDSILFEILQENGEDISNELFADKLEDFIDDSRLNRFGNYKEDVIAYLKEDIEMNK